MGFLLRNCDLCQLIHWHTGGLRSPIGPLILISVQTSAMIATYATAADFQLWEAKAKAMTDAELLYSARDARQAEQAMRGWNPMLRAATVTRPAPMVTNSAAAVPVAEVSQGDSQGSPSPLRIQSVHTGTSNVSSLCCDWRLGL